MLVGVISDIHSNLVALERVLADMPDVDRIVCAGDVVGYNPWPTECVEMIRSRTIPTVQGNHDRKVASGSTFRTNRMAQAGVRLAIQSLTEEQVTWLGQRPTQLDLFDRRLKIVHGHPDDPDRYTYPREFDSRLLDSEDVLVMGHTHIQHVERFENGIILNPGSVGQPRDGDPRAAYAVVDLDSLTADTHRVEYDVDQVIAAIQDAGLPEQTGQRLRGGR